MGSEKQRLSTGHVKVGLPLPGDVYDGTDHLLLSAGYVIQTESQLETLLSRGMYVDIATFQAHYANSAAAEAAVEAKKFDPFLLRDSLKRRLNRALRNLGREADAVASIREIANAVHDLAHTDPEGAVAAGLLDVDENYSVSHSVCVALLCDLVGTMLGWSEDKRTSVVCAALSMNATIADLQNKLVSQTEALKPLQQDLVRSHPEEAARQLGEAGVSDPVWLSAILEHHEVPGGGGYPRQMEQPAEAGQLVRLADMFAALTAARGDRKALPPPQAVRAMMASAGHGPCAVLAGALTKVVGILPPGTFVKLANGEIAVVHRRGDLPNAPFVAGMINPAGAPYIKPVRRDTQRKDFTIVGVILRGKLTTGYDLGMLWIRTL